MSTCLTVQNEEEVQVILFHGLLSHGTYEGLNTKKLQSLMAEGYERVLIGLVGLR